MNSDEIETIVDKLLVLRNKFTVMEIEAMPEFLPFRTKNKLFFETIMAGGHNPEIFKRMMLMKRKLESGATQYEVDVKFGKFMAEKYVDPLIKK